MQVPRYLYSAAMIAQDTGSCLLTACSFCTCSQKFIISCVVRKDCKDDIARVKREKVVDSLQPLPLLAFYGLEHVKGRINGLPVVGLNCLIQRPFGDPAGEKNKPGRVTPPTRNMGRKPLIASLIEDRRGNEGRELERAAFEGGGGGGPPRKTSDQLSMTHLLLGDISWRTSRSGIAVFGTLCFFDLLLCTLTWSSHCCARPLEMPGGRFTPLIVSARIPPSSPRGVGALLSSGGPSTTLSSLMEIWVYCASVSSLRDLEKSGMAFV